MQKKLSLVANKPLLGGVFILGIMLALVWVPAQFNSSANQQVKKGLVQRTESHDDGLENYDIRADKSAFEKIAGFRQAQNRDAALVAETIAAART